MIPYTKYFRLLPEFSHEIKKTIDEFLYVSPQYLMDTISRFPYKLAESCKERQNLRTILLAQARVRIPYNEFDSYSFGLLARVHWESGCNITMRCYGFDYREILWFEYGLLMHTTDIAREHKAAGWHAWNPTQSVGIRVVHRKGRPPKRQSFPDEYIICLEEIRTDLFVSVRPSLPIPEFKRKKLPRPRKKRKTELESLLCKQ